MLQIMNDKDAADVFSRIRGGGTAAAIIQDIQQGSLMMGLHMSEVQGRYEFPYINHIPTALREHIYFRSKVHKAIEAYKKPNPTSRASAVSHVSPTSHSPATSALGNSNYQNSLLAAKLVEPLLHEAKISKWTQVCSNDALLRQLLEAYFIYEYPWLFTFHKDHFLADLLSGDTRFCSSLLVNALLAKACVSKPLQCHALSTLNSADLFSPSA
jgi:hypothetical protein